MRRKLLTGVTMLGFLLTVSIATVYAQAKTELVAAIPFDFVVGDKELKSGKYIVRGRSGVTLMVESKDGGNGAVRLATAIYSQQTSAQNKLVFHRYGDYYFLAEVWTVGSGQGHELVRSKRERMLEKESSRANTKKESAQLEFERVEIVAVLVR